MTPTDAAALWSRLEDELVRRGLVREGRELRENRAALVRLVGDAKVEPVDEKIGAVALDYTRVSARELSTISPKTIELASMVAVAPAPPSDSDISRMLDRYIERSIHGYDQDDEVEYR